MSLSIAPSLLQSLPSPPHTFYTPRFHPFISPTRIPSLKSNPLNCFTPSAMASSTSKGKRVVKVYDTEEQLAVSLADYTFNLSNKFVDDNDAFTVVVSGGSLIKSLRKLVDPLYADRIPWSKWHVFWVDERVVPRDHADSNYKLCYDGFLSKVGIPGEQVYAIKEGVAVTAEEAAEDYERRIREAVREGKVKAMFETGFPKFDLMLLGVGPDGHVASLFPGHPLLKEDKKWVMPITDSPKPPPERITFTFPVINSAANIAVVVTGEGKSSAVRSAVGRDDGDGGGQVLPLQLVSPLDQLVWFLDKPAASML